MEASRRSGLPIERLKAPPAEEVSAAEAAASAVAAEEVAAATPEAVTDSDSGG